jgi:hypothetical protein
VSWKEIEACSDSKAPALLEFQLEEVLRRVQEQGDLFGEVISLHQQLPALGG